MAKEQAKLNKILADEAEIKRLEEEKIQKELEEIYRKEEEERLAIEKEINEEKERKLQERKKLKLSEKQYNEMMIKREETMNTLKESGISSIDEILQINVPTKYYKKKHKVAKKQDDSEKASDKLDENLENNQKLNDENTVDVKIADNADVDDWENEVDDTDTNTTDNKNAIVVDDESENIVALEKKKDNNLDKAQNYIKEKKDKDKRFRCPIICILGHVDTGKTKLLDKLRNTNVQKGEAGGITQQIGATLCPLQNIQPLIDKISHEEHKLKENKIPGLLIIDTPGHASFQNLRVRGQSLCDVAILVIDIMHGLELQTIDSLKMLKSKKTPFIIALNKIDMIYSWKANSWEAFRETYAKQGQVAKNEFNSNLEKIKTQIVKEVGLNTTLYWENDNPKEYYNIIPTSAITGEGIADLMNMSLYHSQTTLSKKLVFKNVVECSVLEVKVIEKVGTTIDIVLVNGKLRMGDKIIIAGINGPIRTEIKYILTPHPMKELRVKSEYIHNKEIEGAIGCKIFCTGLEDALAGSPLFTYKKEEEATAICKEISEETLSFLSDDMFNKEGRGVLVVASSLGALEAIMGYLQEEGIPVAGVNLGYVQKKDVIKILTLHSKDKNKKVAILKEDLSILAFNVHVNKDAQEWADKHGVSILTAEIIYHLKDKFRELEAKCFDERKKEKMKEAIFPCKLKILPNHIFNRSDPIIIGVEITDGILKKDTPLYCVDKKKLLGTVESIQRESKEVQEAFKNNSVSIRIKADNKHVAFKTHFDEEHVLISNISRTSIDRIKEYYYEELSKNKDWIGLIKEFKEILDIKQF